MEFLLGMGVLVWFLLILLFLLLPVIAMWIIFKKAGKPGILAIIPLFNLYTFIKIAGKSGWWILLLLIPFVNIIFLILILNGISTNFGKSSAFTVGLVFLPFIFLMILAFGDAKYIKPKNE